MIEEVRTFLTFVETPPAEERSRLEALAEALDRLALAYHRTPDLSDPDAADMPDDAKESDRQFVTMTTGNFRDLGAYAWVAPEEPFDTATPGLGVAWDDLADIVSDLREVLWCWENTSEADAAWRFRFLYQVHWGRHLHSLRSYLHMRLFES